MTRSNLQIKVGTYTGDGSDDRVISGLGFEPTLVIIKGGSNLAVFRIKEMPIGYSGYLAGNIANLADAIQELIFDGFKLGTDAKVNANGTVYYWIAVKGDVGRQFFATGKYIGNGSDSRNVSGIGINFTPAFLFIKADRADNGSWRASVQTGDNTSHFSGSTDAANEIQALASSGMQLGTSTRVNNSGDAYYYFAFASLGNLASGSYVGNGINNRSISGVGFNPDIVFLKYSSTTSSSMLKTSSMAGALAVFLSSAASSSVGIESFITDGFQVGTDIAANESGGVYWWVALKSGSYNVPLTRLTS